MQDKFNILKSFKISGELVSVEELKLGHIHNTYLSTWQLESGTEKYIHQNLNSHVFKDIPLLMGNLVKIVDHTNAYVGSLNDSGDSRRLKLIPAKDNQYFVIDSEGKYWRTFNYMENSISFQVCTSADLAYKAALTAGLFQASLNQLNCDDFREVIPDFHNLPFRYEQLKEVRRVDRCDRVKTVLQDLAFIEDRAKDFGIISNAIKTGAVPLRVTHNDLKFNNVLFDRDTLNPICVVDLDTCMPSSVLYDFGDLVRSTAATAEEDESDLSKVDVDLDLFKALVEGYLVTLKSELTPKELELMGVVPGLFIMMLGMRFLTDYLDGDRYFKTAYSEHNLVRARNQFQMVRKFEEKRRDIEGILSAAFG